MGLRGEKSEPHCVVLLVYLCLFESWGAFETFVLSPKVKREERSKLLPAPSV